MEEENGRSDFFSELKRELTELRKNLANQWRNTRISIRNRLRQMRGAQVDYIVMPLGGSLPERAAPPRSFFERQLPLPQPSMSMQQLNGRLQAIADADNVRGVVFIFQGFGAGLASLQNMRRSINRVQAAGKEVIVYTPYLDLAHYFVASAADRIISPPSSQFNVLGLRSEILFLKDALQQVGVQADVIQISPYKTAFNQFSEATITPEQQEQMEWLLDGTFEMLTSEMANGRSKTLVDLQQLIDQAPLTAQQALDAGLIDHLAYEDELEAILAEQQANEREDEDGKDVEEETAVSPSEDDKQKSQKIKLMTWDKSRSLLLEKPRRRSKKFIGVISLEGNIMMGPSQSSPVDLPIPFVGSSTAGEQTLRRLLRQAEEMDQMAALIFHVDSGGGSALASDLIGREIERLNKKKPVLVYMGNAAASGGYFVSAPARHIMAQSGTLTGSIGVITMRLSSQGLFDKLSVNRFSVQRGEHAGLYSSAAPMTDDERRVFFEGIDEVYRQFKQVVADGRSLPFDELDPICEGRVWTGQQALDRALVDSHGDFVDAIYKAAALADLPIGEHDAVPIVNLYAKRDGYVLPPPFEPAEELTKLLSGEKLKAYLNQPLFMLPFELRWFG
ncbi:MAG: signal peptide peptidase SppA [Chloroflexi bacterium]|nr:MAG: signal peptide peptidase SppA [Chloroflexota bacterium]